MCGEIKGGGGIGEGKRAQRAIKSNRKFEETDDEDRKKNKQAGEVRRGATVEIHSLCACEREEEENSRGRGRAKGLSLCI